MENIKKFEAVRSQTRSTGILIIGSVIILAGILILLVPESGSKYILLLSIILIFGGLGTYALFIENIGTYILTDDGIEIIGPNNEKIKHRANKILLSEIIDIELGRVRFFAVFSRGGVEYVINKAFASNPARSRLLLGDWVYVYTTNKNNLFKTNNCFLVTPVDKEEFVKAVKDRLEKNKK